MCKFITLNIPKNIKLVIWNKNENYKKITLLHNKKKFNLIYSNNIEFDKWSNSLIFFRNKKNYLNLMLENKINYFLNSINLFLFKKIKFKGKGFRIKFFKKIKLIKFYFGRSHKTFFLLKQINKKKINKYKFIIFGLNKNKINNVVKKIVKIKKINFYTLRGLRLSRQIVFKRKGKKGTYI